MAPSRTLNKTVIRYSIKPKEEYIEMHSGKPYGVGTYSLLDTPEMWNLAYLSFDFDSRVYHKDPHFSTHVRRTCQSRLDGSGPDLVGSTPARELVGSLLSLPAPRFVYLIENHPVLPSLPMFQAYGPVWLTTIQARAKLCQADDTPKDFILDISQAKEALERIMK